MITGDSVGGFGAMTHDLAIPEAHGLPQPVGDSVGPGGIARALRSIPVTVGIARAMDRNRPYALLLNVCNRSTALCRAVTRETNITTVGLCNELVGLTWAMSLLFDVAMYEFDPVVGGVNHCPLVTAMTIGGSDGFAMVRGAAPAAPGSSSTTHLDGPARGEPLVQGVGWGEVDQGRRRPSTG